MIECIAFADFSSSKNFYFKERPNFFNSFRRIENFKEKKRKKNQMFFGIKKTKNLKKKNSFVQSYNHTLYPCILQIL